jgi:hypothetical protein
MQKQKHKSNSQKKKANIIHLVFTNVFNFLGLNP